MVKLIVLLYVLLLLLDIITICTSRRLLFSFLIGQTSRKNAQESYQQQDTKGKITLNYIKPLLKLHKNAYNLFYGIYMFEVYTTTPQYAILLICTVLYGNNIRYALYCFCVIKCFFCFILRLQFDANRVSKYIR